MGRGVRGPFEGREGWILGVKVSRVSGGRKGRVLWENLSTNGSVDDGAKEGLTGGELPYRGWDSVENPGARGRVDDCKSRAGQTETGLLEPRVNRRTIPGEVGRRGRGRLLGPVLGWDGGWSDESESSEKRPFGGD